MVDKTEEKLYKALEAGARIVEKSISKISWDVGHGKIKEVQNRLDYKMFWILDCAADLIYLDKCHETRQGDIIVPIRYGEFTDFIARKNISTTNAIRIFKTLPTIILEGLLNIPIYFIDGSKAGWMKLEGYRDNICGLVLATERTEFDSYRSHRKMRSKGAEREEPVFILIFSNRYGKAFVKNAKARKGWQLQNPALYKLRPEAQELFQKVRWRENQVIILNTEEISKMVGWAWPTSNIHARVGRCQDLLVLLYKRNFINKPIERGKTAERRSWLFFISKGRGVENAKHTQRLLLNLL